MQPHSRDLQVVQEHCVLRLGDSASLWMPSRHAWRTMNRSWIRGPAPPTHLVLCSPSLCIDAVQKKSGRLASSHRRQCHRFAICRALSLARHEAFSPWRPSRNNVSARLMCPCRFLFGGTRPFAFPSPCCPSLTASLCLCT